MTQARLEELFRYFRAASNAASLLYEDIDSPINYRPDEAPLSSDIVVNAPLQLVVHRLGCDRAFVSLIDDEYQFVIAEATRSISLVDASIHDQDDGICIGTRPLTLDAGICAATMPAFTESLPTAGPSIHTANIYADSTRYFINDLTAEAMYQSRPYVRGHPHMRWYAEVPLRTATGHAIGSLAVIDTTSRLGLRDDEHRIMSEIATAIMRHLEMLRIGAEHDRAVNLLNGLDKFMHQRFSLFSTSRQEHVSSTSADRVGGFARHQSESLAGSSNARSAQTSYTTKTPATSDTLETPPLADINPRMDAFPDRITSPSACTVTKSELDSDEAIPTQQEARISIFESAASLLRDAADLDGVVFFDVAPAALSYDLVSPVASVSLTPGYFDLSTSNSGEGPTENQDDLAKRQELRPSRVQCCKRLGYAFRDGKNLSTAIDSDGAIFNLEHLRDTPTPIFEAGKESSTSHLESTQRVNSTPAADLLERLNVENELRPFLPASRSIVFQPLWNSQTENWYAACLAWSTDSRRILQSSELSYITAFSNSIMAEIVNLELLAIDNAKSDFISSISHEVRSPLHGILGSAETLADVVIDKEQRELVQVVESCGRNLLETMDNILHFSKINSKARTAEHSETQQSDVKHRNPEYEASADASDFNIEQLVETCVESLIVSHQHSTSLNTTVSNQRSITTEARHQIRNTAEGSVVVILRATYEDSWIVRSRTVVWQRILMNLLGNAMKYTSTGYIEIDLSATPRNEQSETSVVTLIVRDTGKGISQSYLDHRLYQPFVQEDTLSPGTGLGLSIVKGLVAEIEGETSIRSTKGIGTEATVSIPVTLFPGMAPVRQSLSSKTLCLLGFDVYPELDTVPTGRLPANVRRALAVKNTLKSTCEEWLRMKVNYTNHRSEADASIIVIMEDDVHLFKQSPSAPGLQTLDIPGNSVLILLCVDHTMKERLIHHDKAARVYCLSQPLGPMQLVRIMTQIQTSMNQVRADNQQPSSSSQRDPYMGRPPVKSEPTVKITKEEGIGTEKHVLLVEDNPVNLQLLVRSMQKIGSKFLTATDGQQALETYRARSEEIGHVFMDVSMPVMDGFTATREIRGFEKQQGLPRIPITVLTGLGSDSAREEAENCGSDRFLVKPVRLAMLKSLLVDS